MNRQRRVVEGTRRISQFGAGGEAAGAQWGRGSNECWRIQSQKPAVSEPVFPGRGSGKDEGFRIPTRGPGFKFHDPHFLAVCASHLTPLALSFLVCEMGTKITSHSKAVSGHQMR